MKKFLKRFERLENRSSEIFLRDRAKLSKRFERLEIGDRKLEITITDKITQEEKAPDEIRYSIVCPYCGTESGNDSKICSCCHNSLETKLTENFQVYAHSIKRCACGATNHGKRKECWVCGRAFISPSKEGASQDLNSENVITLNIDGKVYKSTDSNLPFDIKILMDKMRKEGYSKEVVGDWIKQKNIEFELGNKDVDSRLSQIRYAIVFRVVGVIVVVFSMFMFRSCLFEPLR